MVFEFLPLITMFKIPQKYQLKQDVFQIHLRWIKAAIVAVDATGKSNAKKNVTCV